MFDTDASYTSFTKTEICRDRKYTPISKKLIKDLPHNREGEWILCIVDDNGKELTYETSSGFWRKCTYDKFGNDLTIECCNPVYEVRYTRDEDGNLLTREADGEIHHYIASTPKTGVYYKDGKYVMLPIAFTYKEIINHFTSEVVSRYDSNTAVLSKLFLEKIKIHEQQLFETKTE